MFCPFWRKDVSKVCHRCKLWEAIPVFNVNTRETSQQWDCTLLHAIFVARDVVQQTCQMGAAIESFSSEVVSQNDDLLAMEARREMAGDQLLLRQTK